MKKLALLTLALCTLAPPAFAQAYGSYRATCTDIRQRGPYLEAACLGLGGGYHWSRIDLRACGGASVSNLNGQLACDGGGYDRRGDWGHGRRGWDGEYRGRERW